MWPGAGAPGAEALGAAVGGAGSDPQGVAYGWGAPWAPLEAPPYAIISQFEAGAEEALAPLEGCRWLFPPGGSGAGAPNARGWAGEAPGGQGQGVAPGARPGAGAVAGAPGPEGARPVALNGQYDFRNYYDFTSLRGDSARELVGLILAPALSAQQPSETLGTMFARALERFALRAFDALLETGAGGRYAMLEEDRHTLVREAGQALRCLVEKKLVLPHQDLVLCLEAFGASKGRPPADQSWLCQCMEVVLKAGIDFAEPGHVQAWREKIQRRIQGEAELYSIVDVRAWPFILKLAGTDHSAIDSEAFQMQVQLQLCLGSTKASLADGLRQAAQLIADLRQQVAFGPDMLRELFNDRKYDRRERKHLLSTVLRGSPRLVAQDVLRGMDDVDVDISERDDEEMCLVKDLLVALKEDIRCCKHAFFKMKQDWLCYRHSGVVSMQELSPEQVCDHLEDEDNYEELLRTAVNRCLRDNRKFEAARMLARPTSIKSKVYETNRNDKQLTYLISIYSEITATPDVFGPIEEMTLVLPATTDGVLIVDRDGEPLRRLERDLLSNPQPRAVGMWWFWRCFDAKLDFWARASTLAIAYEGTLAIVDFWALEFVEGTPDDERRGKDIVRRILEAPHLLKVVHDMSANALQVLQRAVVTQDALYGDAPEWPRIFPVLDLAVVIASVRKSTPGAPTCAKLSRLTSDFLRLDLCLAEALMNFERRPLRKTQLHYMLTVAWSPLVILRTLCAYGIVPRQAAARMAMQVGHPNAPAQWDVLLRRLSLFSPDSGNRDENDGDALVGIQGNYAENLWDDPGEEGIAWRKALPRPDPRVDFPALAAKQGLGQLLLPQGEASPAREGVQAVFDSDAFAVQSVSRDLVAMYEAYQLRAAEAAAFRE